MAHRVTDDAADTDPSGLGECLRPRGDIDPVGEDIVLLNNHVAEVDPDTEPDPALFRDLRRALDHTALDLHGTPHRVYHARELHKEPIAGVVDDPAPALLEFWLD